MDDLPRQIIRKLVFRSILDIQSQTQALSATIPSGNILTIDFPILIVLIILVLLSSFFSMSETVISSVSETRIKTYVEDRKTGAKKALYCVDHFDRTLTTLLVGNNIVNVSLSTLAVGFFSKMAISEQYVELVSTLVITIVLLAFGEITPKTIGKKYNDKLVLTIGPIIYILSYILFPLVIIFMGIQKLITGKKQEQSQVNESELETILDAMAEDGEIESDERMFIKNVFDLNDRSVEDIMIPRIDMIAIDVADSIDDVKETFMRENYSRIPVFEEDKDHIIGILYERDFFQAIIAGKKLESVRDLMKPAKFVNKAMTVDNLIKELQESKMHMAIVSGEYNDTLGLVTMEDALEEIVGEIYDEHDEGSVNKKFITKIDDNTYYVDGEMFVSDMFDELGIGQAPLDASKVSSWVFESKDELPKVGDIMTYISCYTEENENGEYQDYAKKLTIEIVSLDDRRIEKLKVSISDATKEEMEQVEKGE